MVGKKAALKKKKKEKTSDAGKQVGQDSAECPWGKETLPKRP